MPGTTITIDRHQREPLQRLVAQRISGIGDVNLAIEQRDFAAAERLGLEYGEDLRLLGDLGWDPGERRDTYALTLPPEELAQALGRLRLDAEGGLIAPREVHRGRAEDAEVSEFFSRAREVCGELIERLERRADAA